MFSAIFNLRTLVSSYISEHRTLTQPLIRNYMTFCRNGKRLTAHFAQWCKWLMITLNRLLEPVSIGVSERPTHARSSLVEYRSTVCSLVMVFWPREWGQLYRFCSPLQSINTLLSGQPGSLWSDFPFYKQIGKQQPNLTIITGWSLCQCFPS